MTQKYVILGWELGMNWLTPQKLADVSADLRERGKPQTPYVFINHLLIARQGKLNALLHIVYMYFN
jgi:hypothetical protein